MKEVKAGIVIFLVFASLIMHAQKINSPYSRYGLGALSGKNIHTTFKGMGGISYGYWQPDMINVSNPASYGTFDSTAFIFEIAIIGNFTTHKTTFQKESSDYATLDYVFVGFPVTRWWSSSLGVLPYSKIGYDVKVLVDMSDYNFNNIVNSIQGDGGLNRFYWGNGFNITKKFRLGIDAAYLYGNATRSSQVYFPDSLNILGTKTEFSTKGHDFIFDYGAQYDLDLKGGKMLTLGLVYSNKFNMKADRAVTAYTLSGGFQGIVERPRDTIIYNPGETGDIVIPDRVGAGFVLKDGDKWLIGADIEWQDWSSFTAFGESDSLDDSWRISLGGEMTPKHTSISNLFKRMTYRVGFRYFNSYLTLLNQPINEFGISFGFTLPIKKSRSKIDFAVEVGKRGTTEDGLIQENFVNFSLGVSIFENWFQKRKYK